MAQITWRDVATPDFGSASQSFNNFSKLFGEGIAGLKGAVGGFDQAKSDAAQKQFDLALAQMTDAEDIRKAVASGQVGGLNLNDPSVQRRLDFSAVSPTAMLKQASDETKLGVDQLAFGQSQINAGHTAELNKLTPVLAAARQARVNGDVEGARKIEAGVDWTKAGFRNAEDFYTKGQGIDSSFQGNRSATFSNDTTQRADDIETVARNLVETVRPQGGTPEEQAFLLRESLRGKEKDPNFGRIASRANELLGVAAGGGSVGVGAPTSGGGVGGSSGTYGSGGAPGTKSGDFGSVVFGYGQFGQPPKPLGEMTLAEASQWSHELGNRTKAAGIGVLPNGNVVGTSAMGPFQIQGRSTLLTYAKKMGLDLNTTRFDLVTQERIAKQIFEDSKGGNLKAVWASLPNSGKGAYANQSWEQVRDLITRGEAGADYSVVMGKAVSTQAASVVESAAQDPTGIATRMLAAATIKRDPSTVAMEIGKAFGMDEKAASQTLDNIVIRGKKLNINLTSDQAAEVFKEARRNEGIGGFLLGWADQDNAAGKGMRVKDSIVDEVIKTYASPQVLQQTARDAERGRLQQGNEAGLQAFRASYENYKRAASQAANNPDYNPALLERARSQLINAGRSADLSQGQLEQFLNPQYFGDPSMISRLRVGNDAGAPATKIIAQAAERDKALASRAPDLLGTRR